MFLEKNITQVILKELNEKGIPVIVDWQSPWTGEHYSIVSGFERGKIILATAYLKKYKSVDEKEFEKRWYILKSGKKINRVITIVIPKIKK